MTIIEGEACMLTSEEYLYSCTELYCVNIFLIVHAVQREVRSAASHLLFLAPSCQQILTNEVG